LGFRSKSAPKASLRSVDWPSEFSLLCALKGLHWTSGLEHRQMQLEWNNGRLWASHTTLKIGI